MSAEVRIQLRVGTTNIEFEKEHPYSDYAESRAHGTDAARRMLGALVEQVLAALDLIDEQEDRARAVDTTTSDTPHGGSQDG